MLPSSTPPGLHFAHGTYTGNGATNRAIPHGMIGIPKVILVFCTGDGRHVAMVNNPGGQVHGVSDVANSSGAVTAWDGTNWYAGMGGGGGWTNEGGAGFTWVGLS